MSIQLAERVCTVNSSRSTGMSGFTHKGERGCCEGRAGVLPVDGLSWCFGWWILGQCWLGLPLTVLLLAKGPGAGGVGGCT